MRRKAPAAARNRDPIAAVLADELPPSGLVLEIASGTGEHAVHFARRFPRLRWQPSDPDGDALESIAAWREHAGLGNVLPPVQLDASVGEWPVEGADAIVCINMVHISPTEATLGLLDHAAGLLPVEAPLVFYGPYIEDDVDTVSSNLAFDASLRSRNPAWGIRRLEWLDEEAAERGFTRTRRVEMPANNLTVVYRRRR